MLRPVLPVFLLFVMILIGSGCQRAAVPPAPTPAPAPAPAPSPAPKRPSDADALAFADSFLKARMAGDTAAVSSMVNPSLAGRIQVSGPDPRITAYTAQLQPGSDPAIFSFLFRVAFDPKQPGSHVAVESAQVTWQNGFKVATLTENAAQSLAVSVYKDGKLALIRGQELATAGDLTTLPKMFAPYGAGPGIEFGVGKDGWSVGVSSLDGSQVLWVTRGLHPLLGVSRVNWSGVPTVTPLDLLFEAAGVDAAWAPGGKNVAVTVAMPSGNTDVMVWDPAAKRRFGPNLLNLIGMDYTVKNIRWQSDTVLVFDVAQAGKQTGPWLFDVTSQSLTH